jgi:hypothetical protein
MLRVSSPLHFKLPRCGAAIQKHIAQSKGKQDKTGGSMWAPF